MPTPPVLDFEELLQPISADKPTGSDPREDYSPTAIYQAIREARKKQREAERFAENPDPERPSEPPNWKPLHDLCIKALTTTAKDLEITAYLIEALLRLEGFAGLRDGFRLARELVEKYWDGLYPPPEEDQFDEDGRIEAPGVRARILPLIHLNGEDSEGTLIVPIARVPITDSPREGALTVAQYREATNLQKVTDEKILQRRIEAGAITLEKFGRAVADTDAAFYQRMEEDVNECVAELTKLGEVVDRACQGRGMPIAEIERALTSGNDRGMAGILTTIREVAGAKLAARTIEQPAEEESATTTGGATKADGPAIAGVIRNRQQALETLRKAADFFRATEPHSPLSYTLEQVIRWAGMPFTDLWTELLFDEGIRAAVFKQIGVPPSSSSNS